MIAPASPFPPSDTEAPLRDQELLRSYVEQSSEPAFSELVHRHLDLVYSAALRRLGGDEHAAADVAQQVFTALARQAASLTRGVVLPAWLYATTRNVTVDFVRAEASRRAREREAHTMHELTSPPASARTWENLRPLLDAAMDELSDRDREAVLLRFFARRPFGEIGTALNVSEDAARMRVERALEKLHGVLAKRGVTSTSSALVAVLTAQAATTAPAGLAASIVGYAMSGATMAGAGSLAALMDFMSASKFPVSIAVVGAVAAGLAVYQSSHANSAAAELAHARGDRATLTARLAELEKSATDAEQELAAREAAFERARLARVTELAAAEAERARQGRAFAEFRANHPGFQKLKLEAARASFRDNHGMFLLSMGFSPAQIARAAEAYEVDKTAYNPQLDVRPEPSPTDPALAKFRAWFGDAAADRWAQHLRMGAETDWVAILCRDQFHNDDPLTLEQVTGLTEILHSAKFTKGTTPFGYLADFDWDRALREAETILSPTQLAGLRAMASSGRMQAMLEATKKQTATAPAK